MARKAKVEAQIAVEEPAVAEEAAPAPARRRYRALREITFVTREGNTGTIGSGQKFSTDGEYPPFDAASMEAV